MTENYSNREIDRMFGEIQDALKVQQDALGRIEVQTTKTNGRVTSLRIWRGYITGGIAILSIIVLPIAFWVLTQIISVGNQPLQQVRAAVFDTQK